MDWWIPLLDVSYDDTSQGGSIARLLLDHGADINVQGWTARPRCTGASTHGHLEVVRLLLERGANNL